MSRKTLTYTVKPTYVCTCGASYEAKPEKCENVVGTDHTIRHVENRDEGKSYVLIEMGAIPFGRWCVRLFTALVNGGARLPEGVAQTGIAGVVALGQGGLLGLLNMISGLDAAAVQDLVDELMTCVKAQPDKRNQQVERPLVADDIEEVGTYFKLAGEVFKLHVGFS